MPRSLLSALLVVLVASPVAAASGVPAVSYFTRESRGMAWVKLEDGKAPHVVTAFLAFGQPEVSWAHDGKKALVRISADEGETGDHLWEVSLPDGKSHPVTLPPLGETVDVGYDPQGRLLATTAQNEQSAKDPLKPVSQGHAAYFTFHGRKYALEAGFEGQPELEHAFRFEQGAWKLIETKVSTTGWDYGMRTKALDAYQQLGPRSGELRDKGPEVETVSDAGLKKRLTAIAPKLTSADGEWGRVKTSGGPLYIWRESGEFIYATNFMVWGDSLRRVSGLDIPNPSKLQFRSDAPTLRLVEPTVRAQYLLVADQGAGSHPRLYDTATRALMWSSNDATDACFWP